MNDVEVRGRLNALLGRCLALRPDLDATAALRADLDADWGAFIASCDRLRLTPAVAERILKRGLLTEGALRRERGAALAAVVAAHIERRKVLAKRLDELVAAFNRDGIEPILIKGAVSLWTGTPSWRSLRDIDLLVPAPDTGRAQAIAVALGYATRPGPPRGRRSRHHMPELVRPDLPGWIEIHGHAGNYNAEPFLSAAELARDSPLSAVAARGRVRLPPPHLVTLHALIHHHIGHSADRHGRLDLKGLYEFAAALNELDPAGREALHRRAAKHPRLAAAVDLWVAAASDFYAMPVPAPFAVEPLALERWRTIRARAEGRIPSPTYPGYREEIALSFRAIDRDSRQGPIGRSLAKARVIRSLLPKLY
jgi:hypothetical protein